MRVWARRAIVVQCQGTVEGETYEKDERCTAEVPLDEPRFEAWERGEWIFCPDHQGARANAA